MKQSNERADRMIRLKLVTTEKKHNIFLLAAVAVV